MAGDVAEPLESESDSGLGLPSLWKAPKSILFPLSKTQAQAPSQSQRQKVFSRCKFWPKQPKPRGGGCWLYQERVEQFLALTGPSCAKRFQEHEHIPGLKEVKQQ